MTIDKDPAYFAYYEQLTHQQNMLQDHTRTSTYHLAISQNRATFTNKNVMDVGAGSGILSFFAAQAGAKKVYAIEASKMAEKMKKLIQHTGKNQTNWFMRDIIQVIHSKIEDIAITIPTIDTLISEPIGVLLVHERMLESFLIARDRYLRKDGQGSIFPTIGTIQLAPFTDAILWNETMGKARFWDCENFYGIDISPLAHDAKQEAFRMPVVGCFDKSMLMGPSNWRSFDFRSIQIDEIKEFTIPLMMQSSYTGIMHGIAGWFDLEFIPAAGGESSSQDIPVSYSLRTGPDQELTHWQQVRFLFSEPLAVNAGSTVTGAMHFRVNDHRSYTITISVEYSGHTRRGVYQLQDQTYYYSSNVVGPNGETEFRPEYAGLYQSDEIGSTVENTQPV